MTVFLRATESADLDDLGKGRYDGVCFGAEFCHHRLPRPSEVADAVARCGDAGVALALVTPLVRQAAFDSVAGWLAETSRATAGAECSFGDWGLLRWALREALPMKPVAGRLLGRQRRDPRVLEMARASSPGEAGALQGSLWDDRTSAAFLAELGVGRVELDLLLQGNRAPSLPHGVGLSLCGPWIPVTLSPSCPWTADPLRCGWPCANAEPVRLQCDEDSHPLWSRGNVLFARHASPPGHDVLRALGADRLVWSNALPG